jgi:hypothetical protein
MYIGISNFEGKKDEKLGQPSVAPVHRNRVVFKIRQQIVQNPLRKTP